jgi:transcription termination factor Rho
MSNETNDVSNESASPAALPFSDLSPAPAAPVKATRTRAASKTSAAAKKAAAAAKAAEKSSEEPAVKAPTQTASAVPAPQEAPSPAVTVAPVATAAPSPSTPEVIAAPATAQDGRQVGGEVVSDAHSNNEERHENRGLRFRGREGRVEGRRRGRGRLTRDNQQRDPELEREIEFANGRRNEFDLVSLEEKNLTELREIAKKFEIGSIATLKKSELVTRILEEQAIQAGHHFKCGQLEILPDGKGFLRTEGYLPGNADVYVSQSQIKRFNLKTGDMVSGQVRAPKEMERYWGLLRVEAINGASSESMRSRKDFEKLTPIFPNEKFVLETTQENITARIIDLVTPIGKGQRGLIVAPPKAGKTSLIKNIANSIMANHPEVMLIVLLIDERPEEVTDISRSVKGEVVASTFDELPENHIRVADMVLEKAKRLVEMKNDVVILLDSITRLSRASNLVVTPSGRTMSGGLDPAAMYKPKRLFGAARNIEEGGSLTILATVLVDTGSRMDEYIFEELKGTGNLDLVLDRDLFNQRIFPSIDINKSGTRRDDLLLSKEDVAAVFHLRRTLAALDNDKAIRLLLDRLKNTKSNADFMQIVQKSSAKADTQ